MTSVVTEVRNVYVYICVIDNCVRLVTFWVNFYCDKEYGDA